jgi:hypothetical protein
VTRRGFVGCALAALVVGRAAWGSVGLGPARPAQAGLRFLTAEEARLLRALARRLVGHDDVEELGVVERVDHELALGPANLRRRFRNLLSILASRWAALLTGVGWDPFVELAAEQQDRFLRSWMRSRIAAQRSGFTALKRIILTAYYTHPKSWPAIGYRGPWLVQGEGRGSDLGAATGSGREA